MIQNVFLPVKILIDGRISSLESATNTVTIKNDKNA